MVLDPRSALLTLARAAGGTQAPLAGNDALTAALTALLAQQRAAPAEPQQKGSGVVEGVVILAFLLTMVGIAGLSVYAGQPLLAALALAFGMGVLASKFGTIVDFRFGSSWGSRVKDLRPQGGGSTPIIISPSAPPAGVTLPNENEATNQNDKPSVTIPGIGHSTDPSTATKRMDIPPNGIPASIRYNNPGAQWPSAEAVRFGQIGYGQLSDGQGNKIARFPHPVNGAASNFDILARKYVGMEIGAAGKKWTGSNSFGVPGYPDAATLTADMINDPALAIPFMKAIAKREAGKDSPLTEDEWRAAHAMFRAGSADAYLDSETGIPGSKLPTGADIVALAEKHVGEKYQNVLVPKNRADWTGPWDCAEIASWLVYQVAGILYGCTDDTADPAKADAYTGAWKADANAKGRMVSVSEAAGTPGAFLLRYPPAPGEMGHIAVSDGRGGTIEAASTTLGVIAGKVSGRRWDTGVLPPGIDYSGSAVAVHGPAKIYAVGQPNMEPAKIKEIQTALKAKGFDPGEIDGEFGTNTALAVNALQRAQGLIPDGEVGPETAAALGISL